MGKIVVFLGPSLPIEEAQSIIDAVYLPPAAQSDLISALQIHQPDAIALIDGVFLNSPSTWHKEILYALSLGVAVYGASSMGALRAAEITPLGMVGVGQIYQMYARGELIDDDEVALVHDAAEMGYRPLSEPMVNVRATLHQAQDQGILTQDLYQALIALAKSIYFPERTFAAIFHRAQAAGMPISALAPLQTFVTEHYVDLKRQDAILLLETLRDCSTNLSAHDRTNCEPNFELAQTHVFAALYNCDRKTQRQHTQIPFRQIAECVALQAPDFDDLNFHSLNRMLVQVLATHLNLTVGPAEVEQEKQRFCYNQNLQVDVDLEQWLQDNDLTPGEFQTLMQEMAICRHLQRWLLNRQAYQRNVKGLLDELRLQNRYTEWAETAAQQEQLLQAHQIDVNTTPNQTQSFQELLQDYLQVMNVKIPPISFQDWVFERNFLNTACLQIALMRAQVARNIQHP